MQQKHRRTQGGGGGTVPCDPLWLSNKVLKLTFQFISSQYWLQSPFTNFSQASAFRVKLRKYFCVVHSDCTLCMPFFDKKEC